MAAIAWRGRRIRCLVLVLLLLGAGLGLTGAATLPSDQPGGLVPGERTESLTQLPPPSQTTGPVKVVFRLPVTQRAVFLTIDDGWYPDQTVLSLMQKYHLPVTAFLIAKAMQEPPAYWRQFVQAGGRIEDHTYDHPFLTRVSPQDQYREIAGPLAYYEGFEPRPLELRPPYGDYNAGVGAVARKAGIRYVVMWDAEMRGGHLYTIHHQPLKPGDIILLHWVPGLGRDFKELLSLLARQHLGVADLTTALAGGPQTVIQPPAPTPRHPPARSVTSHVYGKGAKYRPAGPRQEKRSGARIL